MLLNCVLTTTYYLFRSGGKRVTENTPEKEWESLFFFAENRKKLRLSRIRVWETEILRKKRILQIVEKNEILFSFLRFFFLPHSTFLFHFAKGGGREKKVIQSVPMFVSKMHFDTMSTWIWEFHMKIYIVLKKGKRGRRKSVKVKLSHSHRFFFTIFFFYLISFLVWAMKGNWMVSLTSTFNMMLYMCITFLLNPTSRSDGEFWGILWVWDVGFDENGRRVYLWINWRVNGLNIPFCNQPLMDTSRSLV